MATKFEYIVDADGSKRPILKRTNLRYTTTLKDIAGAVVPSTDLSTFTLTWYSLHGAQAVVNSRDGQNILNANNVTLDGSGNLVWNLQPADTQILDSTLAFEWHRALFAWTKTGGEQGKHEVDIKITNVNKVS